MIFCSHSLTFDLCRLTFTIHFTIGRLDLAYSHSVQTSVHDFDFITKEFLEVSRLL